MDNLKRYHGMVLIPAKRTLAETSEILGHIIHGFGFEEDVSGSFEEIPTFVAKMGPFKILLHGLSPEDDDGGCYTLSFQSRESVDPQKLVQDRSNILAGLAELEDGMRPGFIDASEYLKKLILADGRLECLMPEVR